MPDHSSAQPGRRIAVLGTSGAGKTAVAKRLADTLGLAHLLRIRLTSRRQVDTWLASLD